MNISTKLLKRQIKASQIFSKDILKPKRLTNDSFDRPLTDDLLLSSQESPLGKEEEKAEKPKDNIQPIQSVKKLANSHYSKGVLEAQPNYAVPVEDIPTPVVLKTASEAILKFKEIGLQISATLLSMLGHDVPQSLNTSSQGAPRNMYFFLRKLFYKNYGPVFKMVGLFGGNLVVLQRPEHIIQVHNYPGHAPIRALLDSMEAYRMAKVANEGETQWFINDSILTLASQCKEHCSKTPEDFQECFYANSKDLVDWIAMARSPQNDLGDTFDECIFKWSLDCVWGCITERKDSKISSASNNTFKLLPQIQEATNALRDLETGVQFWRIYTTDTFKKLEAACNSIEGMVTQALRSTYLELEKRATMEVNGELKKASFSLLDSLILQDKKTPQEIITNILDLLIIGVTSIANLTGWTLYFLAKTPRAQRRLYNELNQSLQNKQLNGMHQVTYLHSCILEALRLRPPFPYTMRRLPGDTVIHGYAIPKGMYILMANKIACTDDSVYEEPLKFIPERWRDPSTAPPIDLLAVNPLYHKQNDFYKRLVFQQVAMLVAMLTRKFKVDYFYEDIHGYDVLGIPDKPFRLAFVDREQNVKDVISKTALNA